jgi:hypothetical protein
MRVDKAKVTTSTSSTTEKILNFGDFSPVRTEFVSPFSGTRLLVPIKTTSSKLKKPFTGPYGPGTL